MILTVGCLVLLALTAISKARTGKGESTHD